MELIRLWVVGQHLAHFLFGEAYHLVEAVGEGIVSADVESARKVVKRHGTYACDENTFDGWVSARLYGVEECAQIACAMCLLTVFFFTRGIREYVVGEMVILVDEEIDLLTSLWAFFIQIIQLFNATVLLVELFLNSNWQVCCILVTKRVETSIAMCIHRTSVVAQVCIYHCKVEVHY